MIPLETANESDEEILRGILEAQDPTSLVSINVRDHRRVYSVRKQLHPGSRGKRHPRDPITYLRIGCEDSFGGECVEPGHRTHDSTGTGQVRHPIYIPVFEPLDHQSVWDPVESRR
jgi:hypothetical protein